MSAKEKKAERKFNSERISFESNCKIRRQNSNEIKMYRGERLIRRALVLSFLHPFQRGRQRDRERKRTNGKKRQRGLEMEERERH